MDAVAHEELIDTYGRVHRDLRISVTDRCNFRCTYCMPEEGLSWLPRQEVLTFEEIVRIASVLVERFGVESIRLTGGEPLVRAHLEVLIEGLSSLRVRGGASTVDLSMTTNGSLLPGRTGSLVAAGLRRINISLDSLDRDRFAAITRRDDLDVVLAGIAEARDSGLDPVKINVVLMAGVNDDEILDFARFGREQGVEIRFIEFMPLDADGSWRGTTVVSQAEILERIDGVFPLEEVPSGNAPASRFRYRDRPASEPGATIGVIPSVTNPFCDTCDRVRLTAEGQLRNCLFAVDEFDLRSVLRAGGSDDDLAAVMRRAVTAKWEGHAIGQVSFVRPPRSMSQIGG